MELKELVSAAKEKVGNTSLSDRLFTEYFSAVKLEGEPTDDFWNQHTTILKSMSGQYNHDVADFIKKWNADHQAPAPAQQTPPAQTAAIDPNIQAILDAQRAQIEELKGLMTDKQNKLSSDILRDKALAYGTEIHASRKGLWDSIVSRKQISEGTTAEQFYEEVKKDYEVELKLAAGEGARPYNSTAPAAPTTTYDSAEAKANREKFKEMQRAKGRLPKVENQ